LLFSCVNRYEFFCTNAWEQDFGRCNHESGGAEGATRPIPRDGGIEELHGDPTVGPRPKVWTRGQKRKKWCRRWHGCRAVKEEVSQILQRALLSSPPLSSPVAFGASHLKDIRNWNKKDKFF